MWFEDITNDCPKISYLENMIKCPNKIDDLTNLYILSNNTTNSSIIGNSIQGNSSVDTIEKDLCYIKERLKQ